MRFLQQKPAPAALPEQVFFFLSTKYLFEHGGIKSRRFFICRAIQKKRACRKARPLFSVLEHRRKPVPPVLEHAAIERAFFRRLLVRPAACGAWSSFFPLYPHRKPNNKYPKRSPAAIEGNIFYAVSPVGKNLYRFVNAGGSRRTEKCPQIPLCLLRKGKRKRSPEGGKFSEVRKLSYRS